MIDEQRRHDLIGAFVASHGRETAMALAESVFSIEHATKADVQAIDDKLERYATKADLKALEVRLLDKIDNCATKADLEASAKSQLKWILGTMVGFLGAGVAAMGIVTNILVNAMDQLGP